MEKSLKSMTRGAGIIFIGLILSYLAAFFYRVIVARHLGPADYGLLTLAISVLGIGRTIALLGMHNGIKRYIAFYLGKKHHAKLKGIILTTLRVALPAGIITGVIVYFFAEQIAIGWFHSQQLVSVLKIFALIIPINSLIEIFKAMFLAFENPGYSSGIEVIGEKGFSLIFVVIAIWLGSGLLGLSISYLAAYLITGATAFAILELKVYSLRNPAKAVYNNKELLSFSLPLLLSGIIGMVLGWSDTFLLGIFRTSTEVGIYQVGFPLAYSLLMFLRSFETIYYPLSSKLFAKNKLEEITKIYAVISRWIFIMLYPAFLLTVLFAKDIIKILFGSEYTQGSSVLIIIVIGIFIYSILGPAGVALQTFKKTRYIFWSTFACGIANILLNLMLIPKLGIEGAAFATSFSWIAIGILQFFELDKITNLNRHIAKEIMYFVKYAIAGLISLGAVFLLLRTAFGFMNIYQVVFGLVLFLACYLVLLLAFRSFSKEDIMIMHAIEQKLGINLIIFKNVIRRFL